MTTAVRRGAACSRLAVARGATLLVAVLVAGLVASSGPVLTGAAQAAPAAPGATREPGSVRVLAQVPSPGRPAYVLAHRNGRVYTANYTAEGARSRVFEYSGGGTLLRSWRVPGQVVGGDHDPGVQVAEQDRDGRLVLLETSTASVLTLDPRTSTFRRWARFPDLPTCGSLGPGTTPTRARPCTADATDASAVPNYAAWGPRGELYVTDYAQGVLWRVPPGGGRPAPWYLGSGLAGSLGFGTTGIAYRPSRGDLVISQQSTGLLDGSVPASGKLYSLRVGPATGRPGTLRTLWTSAPAALPDGFGIARSGRIYVATLFTNQVVRLAADGTQEAAYPAVPLSGDNGSPVPFDAPCSATFRGTEVLVANQAVVSGDASHMAVLALETGERGDPTYLPAAARWR